MRRHPLWLPGLSALIVVLGVMPAGARQTCGGVAGLRCPAEDVCVMTGKPHPDQAGVCQTTGGHTVCPQIYRPVCGADGRIYSNRCVAERQGATVAHEGPCDVPPPPKPRPDGEPG